MNEEKLYLVHLIMDQIRLKPYLTVGTNPEIIRERIIADLKPTNLECKIEEAQVPGYTIRLDKW